MGLGLDVHARSTRAAAVDGETGDLTRARLGGGCEEVVGWLSALKAPVRAWYEAGPTGFAKFYDGYFRRIEGALVLCCRGAAAETLVYPSLDPTHLSPGTTKRCGT
jgi:hypothetical protein